MNDINKNFSEITLEEKIKIANDSFVKFSNSLKPVVENLMNIFHEFGKAAAIIASEIFTDDFRHRFMVEAKKERHRKRYYRAMERRKK